MNKLIHKLNPDIVHTHRNKENFLGSLAAKIKYNKPSLRTVHGAPEHRPPMHKLAKQFIRLLDWTSGRFIQKRIVAVSADLAEKLKYSFPESKIETIENGIDIDAVTSHLNQTKINDNNRHKIGIIGRLTPVKRIDLFINSAVFIKQQQPELPIDFYIFGDGPLHNSLKAQIKSLHAENYIHFEGHCEQIPQALQTLDALLMTSDHEGLPMVLLEAMCVQTPIIAHAVGGIPHLLKQGKCGALISEHTAEAFAYAILDLIQQPEKYQALAEQALSHVKQKYSNKHTASAYLNLYKELAQR